MENVENNMNIKFNYTFLPYGTLFKYDEMKGIFYVNGKKIENDVDYYEVDLEAKRFFEVGNGSRKELTTKEQNFISEKLLEDINKNINIQTEVANRNVEEQKLFVKGRRKATVTDFVNILKIAGLPMALVGIASTIPFFKVENFEDILLLISVAMVGLIITGGLSAKYLWDISTNNRSSQNLLLSSRKEELTDLNNQLNLAQQFLNKFYTIEEQNAEKTL